MVLLRDKLLQLVLNERERIKDLTKVGLTIGAGDYYRLLQNVVELQKQMEQNRRKRRIFKP